MSVLLIIGAAVLMGTAIAVAAEGIAHSYDVRMRAADDAACVAAGGVPTDVPRSNLLWPDRPYNNIVRTCIHQGVPKLPDRLPYGDHL